MQRFRGLALQMSLLVFGSALAISLFVTWSSVRSLEGFLRGRIDQSFPVILGAAADRLDLWYGQREVDLGVFARSSVVVGGIEALTSDSRARRERAREEVETYLAYVLDGFPHYRSLVLLDAKGTPLLSSGAEIELPEALEASLAKVEDLSVSDLHHAGDERLQLVWTPLTSDAGQRLGTLYGVLRLDALVALLNDAAQGESVELSLVDPWDTRLMLVEGTATGKPAAGAPAKRGEANVVIATETGGKRVVRGVLRSERFGWALVAEQPYEAAFAPVGATVKRALGLNLAAVGLVSLVTLFLAAWRMRAVLDLADAARRIAMGETGISIPEGGAGAIGILVRAFNEMSVRLKESRMELERQGAEVVGMNQRLREQNEELRSANEVLEQLTITDPLTHLPNHSHFQEQLRKEAKRSDRVHRPLSLMLLDLDDFKQLNDSYGHTAGDAVLNRVPEVLGNVLRDTDFVARYGGASFGLLAPETDLKGALSLAEKLRLGVSLAEFAVQESNEPLRLTVSIGVAEYRGDTQEAFESAEKALEEAKSCGKDCVVAADGEEREDATIAD